jgi:hypothetical protein
MPGGMKRRLILALFAIIPLVAAAQQQAPLEVIARVNLRTIQKGAPVAVAYMGAGVTVRVKRHTGEWPGGDVLTIVQEGAKLFETESGLFETAALYQCAGSYHLVVTEYTGGAHCCGRYYVFSRAAGTRRWRSIGSSGAENGGPAPAWEALVVKDGRLYLREMDDRFDTFHACHACSLLVNMGPRYSLVTPTGLARADEHFRDEYLVLAEAADAEIASEVRNRRERPHAVLDESEDGVEASFVDDLGQLLVKRTIFLLRAGEERRAWEGFVSDLRTCYQTADGVELLRTEISELLQE